jgi:hypothetical protein
MSYTYEKVTKNGQLGSINSENSTKNEVATLCDAFSHFDETPKGQEDIKSERDKK